MISITAASATYNGSGSTGPFAVADGGSGIYYGAATELVLTKTSTTGVVTLLTLGVDYTVSGINTASGTVTLTDALAVGETLRIERATPLTQELDLSSAGAFNPDAVETALDKLTRIDQDLRMQIERNAITGEIMKLDASGETDFWDAQNYKIRNLDDPVESSDAVTYGFLIQTQLNVGAGDVVGPVSSVDSRMVEFSGTSGKLIKDGGVSVSSFMKTVLDDVDANAARTTLGAVAGPASAVDSRMAEFDGTSGKLIKDGGVAVSAFAKTLLDDPDAAAARTTLGVNASSSFATKAAAEAYAPITAPAFIRIEGYSDAGDGGGALYENVASSEPSHGGKFSITLADTVTTVWYELQTSVVRPEMFGAFPGVEAQTELQAMLDFGATEVYLPAGEWRSDGNLTRDTDIHLYGPGVLDFSNASSAQLLIQGSITAVDDLSTNVTKHARTLTWTTIPGSIVPGSIVVLWNPTDYSFGGRRDTYRDGGMFKVHSISSNTARTYEMATDAYTAANMNVYLMSPVRVRIEGISARPCSTAELAPIHLQYCADVSVRDVKTLQGGTYGGVRFDRCYNVVGDCTTVENNSPHVNNEYGFIIGNSQHVKITGSAAFATRHAITLGGTDGDATVPSRYVTISGMSIWNSPDTAIGAADIHGNSDYVTYENCVMAGFSGGGRNIRLIGCTIYGMNEFTSGICAAMPETNGGFIDFIDCQFISMGDGNTSSHGYIHVQALGSEAAGNPVEAWVREDIYLSVIDCRFFTPNASSNAKVVRADAINADVDYNITIRGCRWDGATQGLAFLYARETVDAAFASAGLEVTDVYGPADAYLVYPEASIATVPTREMRQCGQADHTTTASALQTTGSLNFRYRYSRVPNYVNCNVRSSDGSAQASIAGQVPVSKIYQITSQLIRPAIMSASGSGFSAGTAIKLTWEAENREF